jgi:hypothetical protein
VEWTLFLSVFSFVFFVCLFLLFGGIGVLTQGLTLTTQTLYQLSHTTALFCFIFLINSHVFT